MSDRALSWRRRTSFMFRLRWTLRMSYRSLFTVSLHHCWLRYPSKRSPQTWSFIAKCLCHDLFAQENFKKLRKHTHTLRPNKNMKSPSPSQQCPASHQLAHTRGDRKNVMEPSSQSYSQPISDILRLLHIWVCKGRIRWTPYCRQLRIGKKDSVLCFEVGARNFTALLNSVLLKVGKSPLKMTETLWGKKHHHWNFI
jgi:hypothetical protein